MSFKIEGQNVFLRILRKSDTSSLIRITNDNDTLKFMSLGNTIINGRKISTALDGEIYLSKAFKERVMSQVKTERRDISCCAGRSR